MLKRIASIALLAVPIGAWAFIKPVRVLAPGLAGVTCHGKICVDDPGHLAEATALYDEAVRFVDANVGALQSRPRAIFCSTQACSRSFGSTSRNAYDVGTYAIVISHRGWKPYFVGHELIHHLQEEHLGSLRNWLFKPDWFREGMAYSMTGTAPICGSCEVRSAERVSATTWSATCTTKRGSLVWSRNPKRKS